MTDHMDAETLRALKERLHQLDRGWPTVLSTAADAIEQLERELAEWKASQHYRYIGVDGKAVLARDLEERAIKAEAKLAAEKSLADRLYIEVTETGVLASKSTVAYRKARGL